MRARTSAQSWSDHPRSRGVYIESGWYSLYASGSSPLARGLLPASMCPTSYPGIIPARAGFTASARPYGHGSRDHPRSRGVYFRAFRALATRAGSSPLARGLRAAAGAEPGPERIIPARAGFTAIGQPDYYSRRDHPRSRGVYVGVHTMNSRVGGSSPLARGLLGNTWGEYWEARIIPARAGFTPQYGLPRSADLDHPRSRGVYPSATTSCGPTTGSSPLARGLRGGPAGWESDPGIIPARAGFTRTRSTPTTRPEDHPRSRGVYRPRPAPQSEFRGSSPLARGLPWVPRRRLRGLRIIPARAGFTRGRDRRGGMVGDHPRSRGVYNRSGRRPSSGVGSSPLARGLRYGCPSPAVLEEDHPRSRGVYEGFSLDGSPDPGSSPLARGLPLGPAERRFGLGIIPARAGFTHGTHSLYRRGEDHPRSRGVYL